MNKPQNLAQAMISQVVNRCIANGSPVIEARVVIGREDIIALENRVLALELEVKAFAGQLPNGSVSTNRDYAGTLDLNIGSLVRNLHHVQATLKAQYGL